MKHFLLLITTCSIFLQCTTDSRKEQEERVHQRAVDKPLRDKIAASLNPAGLGLCEVYRWIESSEQNIRREMETQKGGPLTTASEFEQIDVSHIKAWRSYCSIKQIPDSIRLSVIALGIKWCEERQANSLNLDSAYYARVNAESKARISAMTGGQIKEREAARVMLNKVLPSLRATKDDFTGVTRYHAKSAPKFIDKNGIDVYFADAKNSPPAILRWSVQYAAADWLFIERYLFNIDGNQYDYTPSEVKQDNDAGVIWEWFDEPVDEQTMKILTALANAKSAKMRLEGRDYQADKVFTKAQLMGIRQILTAHEALSTIYGN